MKFTLIWVLKQMFVRFAMTMCHCLPKRLAQFGLSSSSMCVLARACNVLWLCNMPSVAIQTASSDHPPLVDPGSPREPIQRDGPWALWQHASFKPRTRRGNMIGRWHRQGRHPPDVKLMRHCGINTPRYSIGMVAEMQSQCRSLLDMDPF